MGSRIWRSSYTICHYWYELDEEKLTKELDACLVNAQEIDADWQQFEDPYQWQIRPAR